MSATTMSFHWKFSLKLMPKPVLSPARWVLPVLYFILADKADKSHADHTYAMADK